MRKIYIPLFLFLLLISFVSASVDTTFKCSDEECSVGTMMNWSVSILNNLNTSVIIGKIWIVDAYTRQLIALRNSEYDGLDVGDLRVFTFQNLIPNPSERTSFRFKTCFDVITDNQSDPICSEDIKKLNVLSFSEVECFSGSDCSTNEYCSDRNCVALECEEKQVISDHECTNLSCAWYEKQFSGECALNPLVYLITFIVIITLIISIYQNTGERKMRRDRKKKNKLRREQRRREKEQ